MTQLSVNVNKIAVLRNSRGGAEPDVVRAAQACLDAGAHGITVHPRPDRRHITAEDVLSLSTLTREMAHEFGPHGIRVNAIAPGEIDTAILSPGTQDIVERSVPLQRLGKAEEVASLIYFLCTSGASYVNGAEIHVNGGQHV